MDKRLSISFEAISEGDRHTTIDQCQDLFKKHGFIEDFKKYGTNAMAFTVEMTNQQLPDLINDLKNAEFLELTQTNDTFSLREKTSSDNDIGVHLNLTFITKEEDFREA